MHRRTTNTEQLINKSQLRNTYYLELEFGFSFHLNPNAATSSLKRGEKKKKVSYYRTHKYKLAVRCGDCEAFIRARKHNAELLKSFKH